jgi:uncharacterized Zn finger protein (UPF0148 family)
MKSEQFITNKTDKDGAVLCPVCNHGSVWIGDDGKRYTSPMRNLVIPGKVNAKLHEVCLSKIIQEAKVSDKRKP